MNDLKNLGFGFVATALTIAFAYAIMQMFPVTPAASGTTNVQASANVQSYCNIGATTSAVNFGVVNPTSNTFGSANQVTANTVGNAAGNILVQGTVWSGPNSATFANAFTLWNSQSSGIINGNALKLFPSNAVNTLVSLPISAGTTPTNSIYVAVNVPSGQTPGTYTQTLVLQNSCSNSNNANVVLTVNVPSVCFISLSNTVVGFGSINPGSASTTGNLVVDSDSGSAGANILVAGSNWIFGANNFYVTNTLWNPTSAGAGVGNAVSLVPIGTSYDTNIIISASGSNNIYFGVQIPAGEPSGVFTQNIVLENNC